MCNSFPVPYTRSHSYRSCLYRYLGEEYKYPHKQSLRQDNTARQHTAQKNTHYRTCHNSERHSVGPYTLGSQTDRPVLHRDHSLHPHYMAGNFHSYKSSQGLRTHCRIRHRKSCLFADLIRSNPRNQYQCRGQQDSTLQQHIG